jgi:hypothetical protein
VASLQQRRADRVAAYERELGAAAIAPEPAQIAGGAALRKISTR